MALDRQSIADVGVETPAPAVCEVTRNWAVTYRLPTTPAVIPAASLTEQSVIGCTWHTPTGQEAKSSVPVGAYGFARREPRVVSFPPG